MLPDGLVEEVLQPEVMAHKDQSLLDLHAQLLATPLVLSDEGAGVGVTSKHAYRLRVRYRRGHPLLAPGLGVVPVHLPSFPLEDKTYVPDVARVKRWAPWLGGAPGAMPVVPSSAVLATSAGARPMALKVATTEPSPLRSS